MLVGERLTKTALTFYQIFILFCIVFVSKSNLEKREERHKVHKKGHKVHKKRRETTKDDFLIFFQ